MASVSFIYEILEKGKVIVGRTWETDYLDNVTFGELYENIAPDNVKHRPVGIN